MFIDARPLGVMAAYLLALLVVISQPIASLAWFGGMHATLDQAALHEAAVANGHNHHHGTLDHHESAHAHRRQNRCPILPIHTGFGVRLRGTYAGLFQDLLQTIFQAMLAVLEETPSPGEQPRQASPAKDLPSQHSPSVPHRPPILLLLTLTIM